MAAPLRLGYFVPQFPGQTHIFFWREIMALRERGVEVVLLSTRPPPPGLISHSWSDEAVRSTTYLASRDPRLAVDAMFRLSLAELWRARSAQPLAMVRDLAMSIAAARRLMEVAERERIDHIHAHSCGRAALISALAHRMGGPRYSLTLHGPLDDYGSGQPYKWRYAAFATVITEKLRAETTSELAGNLPPRIDIQAMGADTERFSRPQPWQPPLPDEPIRLFSCGRLNVVKGHQDLMEAVRLLREEGLDVRLNIAGEDDNGGSGYRKVLEARIIELGLEGTVTLLGAVSEEEVLRQLLDAHIFVLASWHEPLGVALMEAMSCEVPTVSTAAGGVPELITSGKHGLLVRPKAPEELAGAITQLLADPATARRLAQSGRARVIADFSAATGAETLIRLIGETGP